MRRASWGVFAAVLLATAAISIRAQQLRTRHPGRVPLETLRVQRNVYAIFGAGGNVTVQIGDEGVLVVDSGVAASAGALIAEIRKLSSRPMRFLINTHAHPDHVGGNVAFSSAPVDPRPDFSRRGGPPAGDPLQPLNIIANEHVLRRMTAALPPLAPGQPGGAERLRGMPIDEYFVPSKDMHFNGEAVVLYHEPNAHTDGDTIVLFRGSDVLSAGDVFTPGELPVHRHRERRQRPGRDRRAQPPAAAHRARRTRRKAAPTSFPATAACRDEADVVEFRDMIAIVRDRVQDMVKKGMTLDQIKAARPSRDYDPRVRDAAELREGGSVRRIDLQGAGGAMTKRGLLVLAFAAARAGRRLLAQGRGGAQPARSPKEAAPVDLTGYWVSLVTEDWRWRMVTPIKGDSASVPINPAAKQIMNDWDPAKDEAAGNQCKGYGAPRDHARARPAAHHVAGRQHAQGRNRRRHADARASIPFDRLRASGAGACRTSRRAGRDTRLARWDTGLTPVGGQLPLGLSQRQGIRSRSLEVVTTNLKPGYLRKNGIPYSAKTTVTEYFERFTEPDGNDHLMVMTIVTDPEYLAIPFVVTSDFKKEPDGSKWDPTPCTAR